MKDLKERKKELLKLVMEYVPEAIPDDPKLIEMRDKALTAIPTLNDEGLRYHLIQGLSILAGILTCEQTEAMKAEVLAVDEAIAEKNDDKPNKGALEEYEQNPR